MRAGTIAVVMPDYPVPAHTGYHLRMLSTLAVAHALGWETSVLWYGNGDARGPGDPIPRADSARQVATRTPVPSSTLRALERAQWLAGAILGTRVSSYPFSGPYEAGRREVVRAIVGTADAALLPTTLCHWAPDLRRADVVVIGDAVDIVSDLTRRLQRSESGRNPLRAAGLAVNTLASRAQEKRFFPLLDEVWVTSPGEAPAASRRGARRVVVVPSTVESWSRPCSPLPDAPVVGFIGNLAMPPNLAAARFLVDEVLPRLRDVVPSAIMRIAGAGAPERALPPSSPGLEIHGPVTDATSFVRDCAVAALPVRVRGGVPLKLFEAMALGRPVVATPELLTGLPIDPDLDVLVASSAQEYAESIARLFRDRGLALSLAAHARATFEQNFSLEAAIDNARRASVLA